MVAGLANFAASKGADAARLLVGAGIDGALLDDPDNRVSASAYAALMRAAQRACADPGLALHYGEAVDMSDVSIVGLIMNASENMGEAFLQLNRFGRLALETENASADPRFALIERDGSLWLVDNRIDPNAFPEITETAFARLTCGPRNFLARPHVLEVHVTHPAPSYRADYDRVFSAPVKFDAEWNALRLAPNLPAWPISHARRYVFGVLLDRAEDLLQQLDSSKSFTNQIETLLLPLLHTGEVSANAVAAKLGFSRQTLFRRLRAEETSYEDVLDALRHRMAELYLRSGKTSVNETAYLVGFSDPASFSRAFKRWTGKTPSEVRGRGRS